MTLGRNTFAEQLPAIIDTMPICGSCFDDGYKLTFQPCQKHDTESEN